ncbi:MAG: CHAT domain-containing tetratricopeptide repeat protein [Acidobacteriota bacterium]
MSAAAPPGAEETLELLTQLVGDRERHVFFERHPNLVTAEQVTALCSEVARQVQIDADRALELARTARFLADRTGDDRSRALAVRAAANAHHFGGDYRRAQARYQNALDRFTALGDELSAAVTRSSALHNLGYLGDYAAAYAWAEAARAVFIRAEDGLRLAILDHNFANVLHRQARWQEALERYTAAHEEFQRLDRPEDAAVCLNNVATCRLDLHHVEEAMAIYRRNRAYCEAEGLAQLVMEIDYHLGYVHYLRAEYAAAIHHYQAARKAAGEFDDGHQRALCDLSLSEIYLELNRVEEAADLAREVHRGFDRLKMPYEAAKALTNRAVASSRRREIEQSLELLRRARTIFVREQNRHWPALIDLYRATVLARAGEVADAARAAREALEAFLRHGLESRAVVCELLLARLTLDDGETAEARALCARAMDRLASFERPSLQQNAWLVLGQIEEARGRFDSALEAFRECEDWIERLRDQLPGETLKISFFSDKQAVYESLVLLTLDERPASRGSVLETVEKAKSRALADLLAFGSAELEKASPHPSLGSARADELRGELNRLYRQIDLQQLDSDPRNLEPLRARAREAERQLLAARRELPRGAVSAARFDLEGARASLGESAQLVEYFIARGRLLAFVLDRRRLEIRELGPATRARELHRLLQFQLARLAAPHGGRPAAMEALIDRAVSQHLEELYTLLLEPLEDLLDGEHLVVAPHGFLHYVPFHALRRGAGRGFAIDRWSMSYTPSLGVYHLCAAKPAAGDGSALVMGVADERAPHILEETRTVASCLVRSTLRLGEEASEQALRERGASCSYLHLGTHGLFRPDSPMFSAIQLGTSRLSLLDLYTLRLSAHLVVLSGCGTGLNAVEGADELVGLTRGLLYAGARSVLVTLWDVHDRSTAQFMRRFYGHVAEGLGRAAALREAMREHREHYPQPFHWAPFVLVGQPD